MRFYLAPLEGITGYVFRNAVHEQFGLGIDKYFTPFIEPHPHKKCMTNRALNDIVPEHNQDVNVVPQILTNNAEAYLFAEREIAPYGYNEINLNFGCPSATVTTKFRGAGLLQDLDRLDSMLRGIFAQTECEVSVKTRIGFESPDEWPAILDIYNKYPLKELIIHPRVRNEFYAGALHYDAVRYALNNTDFAVCYNGDINTVADYERVMNIFSEDNCRRFPDSVMTGRGMVRNPKLISALYAHINVCTDGDGGNAEAALGSLHPADTDSSTVSLNDTVNAADDAAASIAKQDCSRIAASESEFSSLTSMELRTFTDALLEGYGELLSGDVSVLHKMKEVWSWLILDIPNHDRLLKKLTKSKTMSEYKAAVHDILTARAF